MLRVTWLLLKRLAINAYRNSIGRVVDFAVRAGREQTTEADNAVAVRLALYTVFLLVFYIPALVALLPMMKMLVMLDLLQILGSVFISTANDFATMNKIMEESRMSEAL